MGGGQGRRARSRRLLAGASAVLALALALSTNVASSLVPEEWAERHATLVWGAVIVLGAIAVWLAIAASREEIRRHRLPLSATARSSTRRR